MELFLIILGGTLAAFTLLYIDHLSDERDL